MQKVAKTTWSSASFKQHETVSLKVYKKSLTLKIGSSITLFSSMLQWLKCFQICGNASVFMLQRKMYETAKNMKGLISFYRIWFSLEQKKMQYYFCPIFSFFELRSIFYNKCQSYHVYIWISIYNVSFKYWSFTTLLIISRFISNELCYV